MSRLSITRQQARKLRDMAFALAEQLTARPDDGLLKDQARTLDSLVRAWETACERERIAAGKPLPGSIRPQAKPQRPKPAAEPRPISPVVRTA